MKTNKTLALFILITLVLTAPAQAAEYTIDTEHSKVIFTVTHLGISKVSGEFKKFSGSFDFDAANIAAATTSATIDSSSIDTSVVKRDEHLKSPDFFDAVQFPEITFTSKKITPVSENQFKVGGDLSMHGVTQAVELDVKLGGTVKDPWGNERAAFTAATVIDRRQFGVVWNKTLETGGLVGGNDVEIKLEIEGIKK